MALCAGAAKQGEQRIDKPACSPDDDACAHPFSGWQVQVEKDEASCFVRGAPVWVPTDTDPCNVLQVGLHCRSQVGSCRGCEIHKDWVQRVHSAQCRAQA